MKTKPRTRMGNSIQDINTATNIATLTTLVSSIKESNMSLTGEVREGNRQSTQQNLEIQKSLAVLNDQQRNNTKYQDECDAERKSMKEDIGVIKTKAALISLGFSWVIPTVIELWLHK